MTGLRSSFVLQAAVWLALAVAAPAWHLGWTWHEARSALTTEARWQAEQLVQATDGARSTWPAAASVMLDRSPGMATRRLLVDDQGRLVSSTATPLAWPLLQITVPVHAAGRGQLTLARSMHGAFWPAAALSLPGLLGLALTLRRSLLAGRMRRRALDWPPQHWMQRLFEHSRDGIVVFDEQGRVLQANTAASALLGAAVPELLGQPLSQWLTLPAALSVGRHDVRLRRDDAAARPCELTLARTPADERSAPVWLGSLRDLSERQAAEQRMRMIADYDSLTGLPNRSLFRDRLHQAMVRADRSSRPMALMFLDLDRFKHVNDSLGHDAGDRLLQHVAATLTGTLRVGDSVARAPDATDAPYTVARLGGDEFTVIVEDLPNAEEAARIAERLLAALELPFMVGNQELVVTGSIGLTVYPQDAVSAEALLQHADLAMYRAKDQGRNAVRFYNDEMNHQAQQRLRLEAELRHALERDEFVLHFQPKADVGTLGVCGVEALLRWHRDGLEVVPPDVFVGLLEDTGLILPVGRWVMAQAAQQVAAWRRAGLPWIRVAVNLSARQLRHGDLVATVAEVLESSGLPSAQLELELTESMLMDGQSHTETLARLSALGVQLSIDDFGTGYSSLSYLKRFNLDSLKLDRSFVQHMPHNLEDNAIAVAVIALARSLKLRVVAEGVESEAQRQFLAGLGCDELQGWLLSRPLPASEFEAWWRARLAVSATPSAPVPPEPALA